MTIEEIKNKLENSMPNAIIEISNPQEDGRHFFAKIIWDEFENKTLVEQHQFVYEILKEEMKEQIHALGLDTKSK
ncbi:BolA family transcriptional regulator [Candidatus Woesearchaeota archaeon]|nr:BolA family transcriptional regulator [Candidatus Woesearchaeota archaeon]MBT4387096.1 BolA family transcriptional regulator [Candidatus Woesearchaeota archaeon]MBT4596147.1 BolA family transcriptional regulator [Candidatus Woesearchaeota archaeon]MBT5741630.1 BolA family transcriptional regulator [Candidatus Woesearchaeota archaeon]MBT6505651.1 BolA family transcriptional regulator [Candidatus Woesearchaeota archaeon]